MVIARLIFIATLASTLQGCGALLAAGAYGGMAASAAFQSRPDQSLNYEIEIATSDGRTLVFKGSTDCPHFVNLNIGAGYSTNNPYSYIVQDGEQWALDGISCDNEILRKGEPRRYLLYRAIDADRGKIYIVTPGGAAQLKYSAFSSSVRLGVNEERNYYDRCPMGPYFYRKMFLADVPPAVGDQTKPIVVYRENYLCGKANKQALSLTENEFEKNFERGHKIIAIEKGHLEYQRDVSGWNPVAGIVPTVPLEVASRDVRSASGIDSTGVPYGCMRVVLGGELFIVSEHGRGSFLYGPSERALYAFSSVGHYDIEDHVKARGWIPCERPPDIERFARGTAYLVQPGRVIRRDPEGGFVCRGEFD